MPCIHAEWAILGGRIRNAGLSVISGNTLLTVACEYCRRAPSDFVCHAGLAIRQPPCSITWDIVWIGNKNYQILRHTVNYGICNNHTKIDWVLLNFTPVIQQNYRQPGQKFEKLFCAAYFREICAPIRSWSDISAQHFPSLPPGKLCFWRPEILYRLKILSCTSHLVTISCDASRRYLY